MRISELTAELRHSWNLVRRKLARLILRRRLSALEKATMRLLLPMWKVQAWNKIQAKILWEHPNSSDLELDELIDSLPEKTKRIIKNQDRLPLPPEWSAATRQLEDLQMETTELLRMLDILTRP